MRWIVGDIHGMRGPLEALVEAVLRRDNAAQLYFCGDYCDRGPHTRQTIDFLLSLGAAATFVRGNHDDVLDLCLSGKSFGTGPSMGKEADAATVNEIKELFLREGLVETLLSYGADMRELARHNGNWPGVLAWINEGLTRVPQSHKTFYRQLPAIAEADDFFVCHATWPADYVDTQGRMNSTTLGDPYLRHDVLWGRYTASQILSKKVWRRIGYFGHTPTDNYAAGGLLHVEPGQIIRGEQTVLLDTAAFSAGGCLSAVCHDEPQLIQVSHAGRLLTQEDAA